MLLLSLITLIPLIKGTLCTKLKGITPGIIIGAGRIGQHLFDSNGGVDQLMKDRNQCIPPDTEGPIYVCTRNEDLEEIINSTPAHRLPDLVFLQNGMIKDYLESKGLGKNTKALIYYAIAKKGDPPIDGKTSVNPEGLTSITGKWADDFAARLANAGLACHILDPTDWEVAMVSVDLLES